MKRHRLALKPILLIDFVLVFVFAIVLLFIYFPPRCFYPNVDFAVNFLGKTRNDVWEVTMAMEKCMDGGRVLIAGDYNGASVSSMKMSPKCDFSWEYWFDKEDVYSEENKEKLDCLLGRKGYANRQLERRWLVFRRTTAFLGADPLASGIAVEFDEGGIVTAQYPYYMK